MIANLNYLTDRVKTLKNESAFVMLSKAELLEKEGKDIIHLEIGEPDFPTSTSVVEKGIKAI